MVNLENENASLNSVPPHRFVAEFIRVEIRRTRISKGLRVKDLAEKSGIPTGSYACLETGRYRLSLDNLFRILLALEMEITDVWPQVGRETCAPVGRVTESYIERVIRRAEAARVPLRPTIDDILKAVSDFYGLDLQQLSGRSKRSVLSRARIAAGMLVRKTPHLRLRALAERLDRDASTISHGVRRFQQRASVDPQLLSDLARIEDSLD